MKSQKIILAGIACFAGLVLASCQPPPPVYVPVYVPYEKKAATPKKTTYAPKPKPQESAEGFRAVEKPTTYSN